MEDQQKPRILFVCTINRMRSATAHKIFETDNRFEVKSAGTDDTATVKLTKVLLDWADAIDVMEKYHRNKIRKGFPESYKKKQLSAYTSPMSMISCSLT